MVLESKREPSTDGIENRLGIKGVSYTCNENHNKEYVHIEIDMPPANGHLVSLFLSLYYNIVLFGQNVYCIFSSKYLNTQFVNSLVMSLFIIIIFYRLNRLSNYIINIVVSYYNIKYKLTLNTFNINLYLIRLFFNNTKLVLLFK